MGIINPYAHQPSDGPRIRLLACGQCKTIEPLDPYNGPRELAEQYDVVLNIAVGRHQDGVERIPHAPAVLLDVAKSDWDNPNARDQIEQQVRASFSGGETGLGAEAYAMRDNFREDAMKCWEKHLRTPSCSEYKADHMRLVPDTSVERKELGVAAASEYDRNNPELTRHLCEYCPVHSLVQQHLRKKAGLYDD